MWVSAMCGHPQRLEESSGSLGAGVMGGQKPPDVGLELSLGSLEEQKALLDTEPSL